MIMTTPDHTTLAGAHELLRRMDNAKDADDRPVPAPTSAMARFVATLPKEPGK